NGAGGDARHARGGLLITTDGVHRIEKNTFEALGRGAASARELVQRLISVSEWTGGLDNATAMYISFNDPLSASSLQRSEQSGLRLSDAYGDLHIVVLTPDSPPARSPRQLDLAATDAPKAPLKPNNAQHKGRAKPKRKNRRSSDDLKDGTDETKRS